MTSPLGRCAPFGLALSVAVGSARADVVAVVSSTSAVTTAKQRSSDRYLSRQGQPLSQRYTSHTH